MDASHPAHGRVSPARKRPAAHADGQAASMRTVDRALAVLYTFSRETPALGVTEISERLGLTKSTVHRILQVLARSGMVAQDVSRRRYTLGYRVLALAQAVPGEATLRQICRPHMQRLRTITEETVALYVVAGDVRMCLDEIESPQVLRMAAGVGRCFPLHRGAASLALLADGPDNRDLWQRATASLGADERERLREEVESLRGRDYALSSGATVPGSASIAAPLRGPGGSVIASISVAGPAARFTTDTIPGHAAALLEGVSRIGRDLAAAHAPALAISGQSLTGE